MLRKKVWIALLIICVIVLTQGAALADNTQRNWESWAPGGELLPNAVGSADAAILMDEYSGQILFEKNADQQMYPASITKIMTAVVAMENAQLSDQVPIIGDILTKIRVIEDGATMADIDNGEYVTVEDLLYGLMLESGADAAIALAMHIGGSYEGFVQMMNQKAQELGMTGTVYLNPHGLHEEGHHSTARDILTLSHYAMQNAAFRKIVGTAQYSPSTTGGGPWVNTNDLITTGNEYTYSLATGIKTGFTSSAGYTLAASATKGNLNLIGVVLKDNEKDRFKNMITLFEYGFNFYDSLDLNDLLLTQTTYEEVDNALDNTQLAVRMIPDAQMYLTATQEVIEQIQANPDLLERVPQYTVPLSAPIAANTALGRVDYLYQGEIVISGSLMAVNDVEAMPVATPTPAPTPEPTQPPLIVNPLMRIAFIGGGALLLVVILLFVMVIMTRQRKNASAKRYQQPPAPPGSRRNMESRSGSHKRRRY